MIDTGDRTSRYIKELEADLAAARAEVEKYKALATEQGCYAAWDEATEDAKVFAAERDAARAEAARLHTILPCGHEARYADDTGQYAECYRCASAEAARLKEYVAEIDDEAVEAVGTPSEYNNGELQWQGRYTQLWRLIARMKRAEAEAARLRKLAAKLSEEMFSVAGFLRGKDIPEYDRVWQMAFDAKAALEGERAHGTTTTTT